MNRISLVEAVQSVSRAAGPMNLSLVVTALLVALAASYAAALMYRVFYENRGTGSQVYRAFPLLGLAITTLFICIQVSIPLSIGLIGSLSIIRFRTPIKEPEEVGFIMLVIAAAVTAATFNFDILAGLYLLALLSLFITKKARRMGFLKRDGLLVITMPDETAGSLDELIALLKQNLRRLTVQSTSSHDGITSIQITFSGLLTDAARLHNVVRGFSDSIKSMNVFLDRPGGMR
ncbi:MAG: DUF4956 domain-containing protein [Candidatus Erginobacter occultus]|nr:DUF4956 domain-containing protein [Candidatus Erginobacter occultus]